MDAIDAAMDAQESAIDAETWDAGPSFARSIGTRLGQLSRGSRRDETVVLGAQGPNVDTAAGQLLNFASNNYLDLAANPAVGEAVADAARAWGVGTASVRFISGTTRLHKELERRTAAFLGYEDALLFSSCFDANVAIFSALVEPGDVVLSDALNHASIIDGIRLCRATSHVYAHRSMSDLERHLRSSKGDRVRLIVTDGVFSMEGSLAPLAAIMDLAAEFDAAVVVDDSHGHGVLGGTARGTAEHLGLLGGPHLQTGTFGKALCGASGGFIVGAKEVVEVLRQAARPYLFSNALPPPIAAACLAALDHVEAHGARLVGQLAAKSTYLREGLTAAGFTVEPGEHPIIPVMIGPEDAAQKLAAAVRELGVLVVALTHPVVPAGQARIRVQVTTGHTIDQLDMCVNAFVAARATVDGGADRTSIGSRQDDGGAS